MKKLCEEVFHDPNSRLFRVVNDFFALLTLISIFAIVLETVYAFSGYQIFYIIEYATVFFFTLEYLGRIIASKKPLSYVFSFFGIVDLIAIVPTYLGLANLSFLKSVRILRILRLLRMLRLVKLMRAHTSAGITDEEEHTALLRLNVQIYFVTLFAAILLCGAAVWAVESPRPLFENIPQTMLWSTKVLLGGVSPAPVTTLTGELILVITRFVGLVLFGLLVNVVGGGVKKLLLGVQKSHHDQEQN